MAIAQLGILLVQLNVIKADPTQLKHSTAPILLPSPVYAPNDQMHLHSHREQQKGKQGQLLSPMCTTSGSTGINGICAIMCAFKS